MTFDNNQLSTVLLLVETSQLQEPELSEAWALLKHIQDSQMIETNYPVCDGCDSVAGCSKVKDKACLPKVHATGWPAGMLQDDSRELSRHLSNNPNARQEARAAAEQLGQPPTAQTAVPDCGIKEGESIEQASEGWAQWCEARGNQMLANFLRKVIAQPQQSADMPDFVRWEDNYSTPTPNKDGTWLRYSDVVAAWPKGAV